MKIQRLLPDYMMNFLNILKATLLLSDIFIRGIDSIIEVLKLVEELIDRYKDARISADIDNT